MKKMLIATTIVVFVAVFLPVHVLAQAFDYGDAPEDALAYPSAGTFGFFPTCLGGSAGFIRHTNFGTWFGSTTIVDFEPDGNAGLCPSGFPPYDQDECFADGDAGLILPAAYTIDALLNVVPCSDAGAPLGSICQTASWGTDIDIDIHNWMPNHPPYLPGYVNVLIDWNQDGMWGGSSSCPPSVPAPEHVLVNHIVPPLFDGPLSATAPPSFLIGPNDGYVWVRFSITESAVPLDWDGTGDFEDGESEDYLLRVDPADDPTVFPVVQTECPETVTECTLEQTHCPVEQTLCPVIDTQCPADPIPTICPEAATACPEVETECATIETLCSAIPTWCPELPTLCPKVPDFCPPVEFTIWPQFPTECPVLFTVCPLGPTLCPDPPTDCPGTSTWCPEIPTECPIEPIFTFCPLNDTMCPDDPTNCPLDWTFCPNIPTVCPDQATACPEVPTVCPATVTECAITPTECPEDITYCTSADSDADGINDCLDNCPNHPNGPSQGTCTQTVGVNLIVSTGQFCTVDADCDPGEFCEKIQADNYPPGGNGIGDACDCEGNFDCDDDTSVDANDVTAFLIDFGRNIFLNPCTTAIPCNGDFLCDGDVDADDVAKFLEDFGRSQFNKPCPSCTGGPWCAYP